MEQETKRDIGEFFSFEDAKSKEAMLMFVKLDWINVGDAIDVQLSLNGL